MKKKIALMLVGMMALTGCGAKAAAPAPDSSTAASSEESAETATSEAPGEEEKTEETTDVAKNTDSAESSESVSGKVSNKFFEITIPDDLAKVVSVDVSDDRIDVYHKESKDAGFGGLVFSVWAVAVPREYAGGPYVKIGELSNENAEIYDIVKGMATEIQWDYNLDDMPADFKKIDDATDSILASITGINGFTYVEGAGTKGEDLYNTVLAKYVTSVKEEWDADKYESEKMSPEFFNVRTYGTGDPLDSIGYAYADLNADGIEELMVGEIDDDEATNIIFDIYTIVDGQPASVVSGSARDRYYNYDNDFIANEGSGGAGLTEFNLYALMENDTEIVLQYGYKYDSYENEDKPWFKTYDQKEYESITEDEFNKAIEDLEAKYVQLDYKPLSQNDDAKGLADYDSDNKASASDSAKLPKYEYPGPEAFYAVLYEYLVDKVGSEYEPADVCIPCPIIFAEDESDKDDIKVYADFWVYNYDLKGDTLEMVSGGSYPGCMHLKTTDSGYEVTGFDVVEDGSDHDPSAKKIFGDHYDEYIKSSADEAANEKTRAQIIANYVAANNLSITQYQDYGWDPVTLPEENIDSFYSQLD